MLLLRVLLKKTLNIEIKNNLLPLYKVTCKWKTFLQTKYNMVSSLEESNRQKVKICQSILQRINKARLKPG